MKNLVKLLFLILFVFLSQRGISQNLYFIQGQNFLNDVDEEGKDLHPVYLYLRVNDSLLQIKELSINNSYIENIRMYYSYKKMIIYYSPFLSDSVKFEIIDFDKKLSIFQKDFKNDEYMFNKNYVIKKGSELYIIVKQVSRDYESRKLIGVNIYNHTIENFSDSDMKHYIGEGCQGLGVENFLQSDESEKLFIKAEYDNKGEIFYYLKSITDFDKKYPFPMPNIQGLKTLDKDFVVPTSKYGQYQIKINTDDYMIIYGKVKEYDGNTCKKQYLIYDKLNDKWIEHYFKGSYPTLRAYGEWLTGAIVDNVRNLPENKKELSISGKQYRVQERTQWGSSADLRFNELLMYPYGILFLYNYKSNVYVEWEALENGERQADSEILYVESNSVIYRVNNKIYSVEIINGEKLGQPDLLIQDERVPYIHWAFISEE